MPPAKPDTDPPPTTGAGWELLPDDAVPTARPRMHAVARVALAAMAVGFTGVFGIAAWLRPYDADGNPRTMATHTQLGMPECNLVVLTGKPCPSCGMTTSFSLLMHGDVANSLRANWVGTLLALFWLALIPWGLIGAARGRLVWVRNGEAFLLLAVGVITTLMLARWAVIFFF